MTVIKKERVAERPAPVVPVPQRHFGAAIWILTIIAVGAVVAAVILLVTMGGEGATTEGVPNLRIEFRSEQQQLADLANQGYIPAAAVDWELLRTERLVNEGVLPAQTLEPYSPPVEPLFTAKELLTIELAESGQIPMEAVDWKQVELKRLINQGMIPREALSD